ELKGVEARGRRSGGAHRGAQGFREFVVGEAGLGCVLRRDTVDEAGEGAGKVVGRRLAVEEGFLPQWREALVGPDGRELGYSVAARLEAESLEVVPEDRGRHAR